MSNGQNSIQGYLTMSGCSGCGAATVVYRGTVRFQLKILFHIRGDSR